MTRLLRTALVPLLAVALGLVLLAAGLQVAGYDAAAALAALLRGSLGGWYAFTSGTLVRATPLLVIGLGVAFGMRGGALNIGGEGQFAVGAIAATWIGLQLTGLPSPFGAAITIIAAGIAGTLWVAVPVLLRLRFGVLEVISTLLLNFVAEALVSWMVTGALQEPTHVYPQSAQLPAGARLPLLPGTRLHLGLALGLAAAAVSWFVQARTYWGYALRAAGDGPRAAKVSGQINVPRMMAVALLWSGALAGAAGGIEVAGVSYALYPNLSPGYGYTALAVALLARLHPVGIAATALLFGALEAGAGAMQRDAGVPSVAVYVVEAVVIVTVLVSDVLARRQLALEPADA